MKARLMNFFHKKERPSEKARGQALAETALVMVILLLLLSVIVDGGRMMFTWLAMQNAAAEGAYYGTTFDDVGSVGTSDPNTIIYRTQHESPSVLLDWTKPGTTVSVEYFPDRSPNPPLAGDFITVGIAYPFDMIGPIPGMLGFPTQIFIGAEATQVVLADFTQTAP
jgi:hypothetical protein